MQIRDLVPIVLGCAFLSGCGDDAIKAANKFSDNLVAAAGKIDPLALKQILDDNKDLQSRNKALEAALARAQQAKGVINLRDGGAFLVVSRSSGTFELQTLLDDRAELTQKLKHTDEGANNQHWAGALGNGDRVVRIDEALKTIGSHSVTFGIQDARGRGWFFNLSLRRKRADGSEEMLVDQDYQWNDFKTTPSVDAEPTKHHAFSFDVIFVEPIATSPSKM